MKKIYKFIHKWKSELPKINEINIYFSTLKKANNEVDKTYIELKNKYSTVKNIKFLRDIYNNNFSKHFFDICIEYKNCNYINTVEIEEINVN